MEVRDSTAKLLHIWGPYGCGKSALLIHRARRWLAEGKAVVLTVGREIYDVLLAHVTNAVKKDQSEGTRKRIRVCHVHKVLDFALKDLRGQYPNVEICLIIDTLREDTLFQNVLKAVKSNELSAVWSVCRDNLFTINERLSKEARDLGWQSFQLSCCIRCTEDTVDLMNQLERDSPNHTAIVARSVPRAGDMPKWQVIDHGVHSKPTSDVSSCESCRSKLTTVLSSSDKDRAWNEWIAICTGKPNVYTDLEPLTNSLQKLGLPAFFDPYYSIVASHGCNLESSEIDIARWLDRVISGTDERGSPTLHVVRMSDIGGVEKEGVLLVHQDKRDRDPNCQSPQDRQTRLADHRMQWIRAVSRCKGQVILLLLTPSPARSLLGLPEPDTAMK